MLITTLNIGLNNIVDLKYIESINDKNKFFKWIKEKYGLIQFKNVISDYDIIHIHMASRRSAFRKGKYVRIAKKNGKKCIIHMHGAEFKNFYDNECNKKQREYIDETFRIADKIIVLSEEWKEYFSKIINSQKITVIYNSIVIPENFEKNTDTEKLLFLGRFGQRKGIYDLIDVMEKICKIKPNLTLYAGGDGEVEKVRKIVMDKSLEKNIKILGWVNGREKEKLLRECSYYILPSYNEGMPMSVIEGMAYKNVTISTNVGGIPKVITNMQNGILINPGDKEALYNYLYELLENKKLRIKLSENGRKTIENRFNIYDNIKKLIEVYEDE